MVIIILYLIIGNVIMNHFVNQDIAIHLFREIEIIGHIDLLFSYPTLFDWVEYKTSTLPISVHDIKFRKRKFTFKIHLIIYPEVFTHIFSSCNHIIKDFYI